MKRNYCRSALAHTYITQNMKIGCFSNTLCVFSTTVLLVGPLWQLYCVVLEGRRHWHTTLKADRWIGAWHEFLPSLTHKERIPLCDGASPVNKSTDDPNSHQQLQHQGQVDFSYETCSERQNETHGGSRYTTIQQWFSPNPHFTFPFRMTYVVWEVKHWSGVQCADRGNKFSISNQFQEHTGKENEAVRSVYPFQLWPSKQKHTHLSHPLLPPILPLTSFLTSSYDSITKATVLHAAGIVRWSLPVLLLASSCCRTLRRVRVIIGARRGDDCNVSLPNLDHANKQHYSIITQIVVLVSFLKWMSKKNTITLVIIPWSTTGAVGFCPVIKMCWYCVQPDSSPLYRNSRCSPVGCREEAEIHIHHCCCRRFGPFHWETNEEM